MATLIQVEYDDSPIKRMIAAEVKRAIELFLAAGVGQIERACNERRELLIAKFTPLPHDRLLANCGLPETTVARALEELAQPFHLLTPLRITRVCYS